MREGLYRLLEGPSRTPSGLWLRSAIQGLILLNVAAVVLETVEPIGTRFRPFFDGFELLSLALFTLEYAARLASCTVDRRYQKALRGRLRWALTPLALVDLVTILPAYLPFLFALDLRVLRAVRLLRVFRIFKLTRYSGAVQSLTRAFAATAPELIVIVFGLLIVLTLASSLVYFAEREAQPEAFSSIPAAAWWGIATLTTVGYGDLAPVTVLGRVAAGLVAIFGIGLFALPAGILGSAFVAQLGGERRCPRCGERLGAGSKNPGAPSAERLTASREGRSALALVPGEDRAPRG